MDKQDQKKMQTPGHESHGVHVCHKCGWPFPNSHPSAKHRRAHKKVCGTIEGYKVADSEDHVSDEDLGTPSPKLVERSNSGEHTGPIGERLIRTEDEVFSDAVTEFPDTGISPGTEEHSEDARVAVAVTNVDKIAAKDLTVFYSFNDIAHDDVIELPGSSTDRSQMQNLPENTADLSGSNSESLFDVSSSTKDPAVTFTGDKNQLACDLSPIKSESPTDASQEIKMINADDDVTEGSVAYVGQETDAKGNGEVHSDRNLVLLPPGEYTGQKSEAESKTHKKEDITSDAMPADGVVLLKEEHGVEMASKKLLSDPISGVESSEHMDGTDTAQVKVGAEQGLDLTGSINSIEASSVEGVGKEIMHELSVADIPVVDNAEIMLKDFKDHNRLNLLQSVTSDSCEGIKGMKDDVEDPVSVENFTSFHSVEASEMTKVSASDLHVLEDNIMHEGSTPMVKKLSCEEKSDEPLILNEVNETVGPVVVNAVDIHDSGHHEKAKDDMCNVAGKDENERSIEASYAKNRITTFESATDLPESSVNQAINFHGSDDASEHEKAKVENCDEVGVESMEESAEGKLSLKTETAVESASSPHESLVSAEDVISVSATKSPETEFTNLDRVSATPEAIKQLEINGNDKALEECVAEHGRDVEIFKRTSDVHATINPLISPLDTESSIQNSVAVNDNHAKELGGEDSSINLSLQGENAANNFLKHQLGASVIDVSADSFSQTDSLDANWGSISVLSTQSDTPPVVDTETLPSNDSLASMEAENTSLKKREGITERQHSEKSDVFEAPSFMTLVEPGGGGEHKAAASDIRTVQNPPQEKAPSSQAGWFPSLTHVMNESQGRKKNEAIIAKVTNWSTGKQLHTPLKNLLVEANLETKPKSPNPRENKTLMINNDETMAKNNNGAMATTVSSIPSPKVPTTEHPNRDTGKELNSPARYPADSIKREKRKVKGRPYWVQFVCCSSVN